MRPLFRFDSAERKTRENREKYLPILLVVLHHREKKKGEEKIAEIYQLGRFEWDEIFHDESSSSFPTKIGR